MLYRVGQVVMHLGWGDFNLGSSLGCWAATVITYCPFRLVDYLKPKPTQPRCATTCPTLYSRVSSCVCRVGAEDGEGVVAPYYLDGELQVAVIERDRKSKLCSEMAN